MMIRRLLLASALFVVGLSVSAQEEPRPEELTLDDLRAFTEVFARVQRDYVEEVSDRQLLEDAIRGMLSELDPHTDYLTREQYAALEEDSSGNYGGVGIEVEWQDRLLTITRIIPGGPAHAGDVAAGDIIAEIDGREVAEMAASEALSSVRGEPGSSVDLVLLRGEPDNRVPVTLERAIIATASVSERLIDGRYAYLDIASFQADTAEEVSAALERLAAAAIERPAGIILDLRGNAGGVLGAAVALSDLFLEDGLIVYTEGRSRHSELRFSAGPGDEGDGAPIVVLVDERTASASEIVAGALQDHGRAAVVGTPTFGKGSVQTVMPLFNGGAVKLTTARYFTPSGRSIQAAGIIPDIDISGNSFTREALPSGEREADLEGHLTGENESALAGGPGYELAEGDYALYRAISLLEGHTILSRAARPDAR